MPLIPKGDGQGYITGPYDVLGIMQDVSTGRFHACLWLEAPLPSQHGESDSIVRLKSKFHHTAGAETFEGALAHVAELRQKIEIEDSNVWTDPSQVVGKDFTNHGYADICIVPNWRTNAQKHPVEA